MFVKVEDWKDFLLKFSHFVQREQAEKAQLLALVKANSDRVGDVERKTRSPSSNAPSFAGFDPFAAALPAASSTSASAIQGLETLFETLAQRITALEIDLSTRPSLEGNEKIVGFGSLNVSTIQDTEAWIVINPDAMKWGYLTDVYTIYFMVSKVVHGESDYYKKMQTVQKLDLGSPREAKALAALSAPIPSLFTDSGKGMFGKRDSAFSQFPTFASFKA